MSKKPTCGTCAFYKHDENSIYRGMCGFRLPVHANTSMNIVQAYLDWCDLHKPKEEGA